MDDANGGSTRLAGGSQEPAVKVLICHLMSLPEIIIATNYPNEIN